MKEIEKPKKKNRIKKILLTVIASLVALFALVWLYKFIVLSFATVVIRYSFTGLENMFHAPYEYYAVAGPFHAKVSKAMVETWYPDCDMEKSIYDDEENQYYFVQLQYSRDGRPKYDEDTISLPYDREYVLTYNKWVRKSKDMSEKAQQTALQAIEQLYDFDKGFSKDQEDPWIWNSGNYYGLESFILITHGDAEDRCVLNTSAEDAIYTFDDGHLVKIMKVPNEGSWDYAYFVDR